MPWRLSISLNSMTAWETWIVKGTFSLCAHSWLSLRSPSVRASTLAGDSIVFRSPPQAPSYSLVKANANSIDLFPRSSSHS